MIYFDINKQANAFEIENPLCVVELEQWQEFSTLTLGKEYDVTADGIIDLRETEEYKVAQAKKEREKQIQTIKSQLLDLDAQAIRPLRAILTDCGTDEDREILQGIETQAGVLREELSSFL